MKGTILSALKGKNSCKMHNFRIKVNLLVKKTYIIDKVIYNVYQCESILSKLTNHIPQYNVIQPKSGPRWLNELGRWIT